MRVPKFQICKFCWWASLQIFHHKTERIKHLFFKFPLFIAKLSKSHQQVCFAEFFIWKNFELEYFRYVLVRRKKRICGFAVVLSSQKNVDQQIAKNIGSTNCKFANCHTCGRSANITNFVSPKICGFAVWWTKLRNLFPDRSPLKICRL